MKMALRCFLAILISTVIFSCTPVQKKSENYTLVVLHTNDHHGHPMAFDKYPVKQIGGMPARATLIAKIRAQYPNVLLLDAGDMNTGRPESMFFNAEPDIIGMNYMKYDAMVLGNHEFDAGLDVLNKQMKIAQYPFISANIRKKDGTNLVQPYILKKFNGFTVAIIGLTTNSVRSVGNPEVLKVIDVRDEITTAKNLVPELRKKADIVIALTHMGTYMDDEKNEYGSRKLASQVPGIDLIVDGHSHTYMEKPLKVGTTTIVQDGDWGINLGMVTIIVDKGVIVSVNGKLLPINDKIIEKTADGKKVEKLVGEPLTEDAKLLALLKPYNDKVNTVLGEKIGTAPVAMMQDKVREEETAIGDFISDSMLWYVNSMSADNPVDFAIQNGGGIRATMPDGDITKRIIYEIVPFDNSVVVCELTGEQVLKMFDYIASITPGGGAFPQVSSGVSFTINYNTGKCENILIGGKPVDPAKKYRIATNSYMADGGDNYAVFKKSGSKYDTSKFQRDVLIEYIRVQLKGEITAPKTGRIIIIPKKTSVKYHFPFAA